MKRNKVNSTQIAKLAGVSRSTVSRVINNYPSVPPETREKVMNVIKEYNYFPDMSGQVLAGKSVRNIGLFIIEKKGSVSSDPTYNKLITSVIEEASAHDYFVLTNIIRNKDSKTIERVKSVFYQNRIDAGIFMGSNNHEPLIEELIAEGFIIGIVDQNLPGREEANRIVYNFDTDNDVINAIDYLVSLNHRHIGIINGDLKRHSGTARYEGYLKAMKLHDLPIRKEWILPGDFNTDSGYNSMKNFLKTNVELPTAFVSANDSIAFGVIRALNEKGIRVPDDVSVIGIDDHAFSAFFHPPLTTFRVDFHSMMHEFTYDVIKAIEQPGENGIKVTVGSELIIRESCRAL